MASDMVLAYGDSGTLELTPAEDVVEICCIPLGSNNEVIPATVRHNAARRGGGIPISVRRIYWPSKKSGRRLACVEFDCTPFVRYTLDSGPVYGDWSSCCIRNSQDAADPIFSRLTAGERKRIERAARITENSAGAGA